MNLQYLKLSDEREGAGKRSLGHVPESEGLTGFEENTLISRPCVSRWVLHHNDTLMENNLRSRHKYQPQTTVACGRILICRATSNGPFSLFLRCSFEM